VIVGVKPSSVWELVSAVGRRDLGSALATLARVYDPKDRGLPLLGTLAWSTRQLVKFSAATARGLSPGDAARHAGAPPFKAGDLAEQSRRVTQAELERWLLTLAEVDLALKGGSKRPPQAILEAMVITLCGRKRGPRSAGFGAQGLTESGHGTSCGLVLKQVASAPVEMSQPGPHVSGVQRSELPMHRLETLARAPLPTRFGTFQLHVFRWDDPKAHPDLSNEHLALVMGDVKGAHGVPVRVHSECLTSEVFGSLKCDCKQQLEQAQAEIARLGTGALLYLRQEGRGIGLANKIRAYALQELGANTIEANRLLHLPVDALQYDVAAAMIRSLGIESWIS